MLRRPKVAVLGANGQVGAELTLLLALQGEVEPVAVGRSAYGLALLRKLGTECRVSPDLQTLPDVIADCDVVVDLALPSRPNTAEMRADIRARAEVLNGRLPPTTKLIYTSTLSVLPQTPGEPKHTIYRATKLYAERKYGLGARRSDREFFVLRLGQVHGAMQGATLGMMRFVLDHDHIRVPSVPSITMFVSTLAEAVEQISAGRVKGGTYNLTAIPPLSYEELTNWIADEANTTISVTVETSSFPGRMARTQNKIRAQISRQIVRHKEFLTDIGYHLIPDRIDKARVDHHCRLAAQQMSAWANANAPAPYVQNRAFPDTNLQTLSDPRQSMPPRHALVKARIAELLQV